MKKLSSCPSRVKSDSIPMPTLEPGLPFLDELDTRIALIQALIPIGLAAVSEVLEREVEALCGIKHSRKGKETAPRRWGRQRGSVYLSDQKVPVLVPRVRDVLNNKEVELASYDKLQNLSPVNETLLVRLLSGLSARRYADCAA